MQLSQLKLRNVLSRRRVALGAALGTASLASLAPAASLTWDTTTTTAPDNTITAGSGTWDLSPGNTVWNNAGTHVAWTDGNQAVFSGADGAAGAYSVSIGSTALSLANTIPSLSVLSNGYIFTAPSASNIAFAGGTPTVSISSGKTTTIGSNVTLSGGTTAFEITGGSSTSTLNIEAGATIAGAAFSRLNNGILNVNGGSLTTGNTSSFAIGNTTGASNVAVVNLNSGLIQGGNTSTTGVRFGSGGGTTTATLNLNGGVLAIGQFTATAGTVTSTVNFNGGTLQARVANANFFNASTANTSQIQAGGAVIDSNGFNITIARALTHDSALGATPDGGLTKIGTGTLTLSASSTYTGATTVAMGQLTLNQDAALAGVLPSTALTLGGTNAGISSGGTLAVTQATANDSSQSFSGLTLSANTSNNITITPPNTAGRTANLTIGNTWTRNAGSVLTITLNSTNAGSRTLTSTPSALSNGILGFATVTDATATGFAALSGGNLVRNTSTTALAISSNDSTANYATTGSINHNSGDWSANSIDYQNTSDATFTIGGGILSLTSQGFLVSRNGGNTAIVNGQLGASNTELIFHVTNAAGVSTINSNATISSGTGSLTKTGNGQLRIASANTYSGNTVIHGGTLQIGNGGTTGSLNSASNIINNATLTFSRTDNTTVANNISGTGNVQKNSSGAVTLSNNLNRYVGTTTINNGTLIAAGSAINKLAFNTANRTGTSTSVDSAADLFTIASNTLTVGDRIFFVSAQSTPGGISVGTTSPTPYYVTGIGAGGAGTFRVATSLANALSNTYVDVTSSGSTVTTAQFGVFGAATSAIGLGDTNTTTGTNVGLLLGDSGTGYETNRPVTVTTTGSATANYSIGGNTNANNTFSGLITANKNLTVSQVTTTGSNTLSITGGITGSTVASAPTTVTFAGPGAINVANVGITNGSGGGTTVTSVAVTGGTTTLAASNGYTGTTSITGGTLKLSGSIAAGSAVSINSSGKLMGLGTANGTVAVNTGGTIAPGNSPGILNTGATTFNSGGTYQWEINNWTGTTAGTDFDQLNITGGLTVASTAGTFPSNTFKIDITGLTAGNIAGSVPNFNAGTNRSWIIATASTGISGFDSSKFLLDTTNFSNSLSGGSFSIDVANGAGSIQNLVLNFTAGNRIGLSSGTNVYGLNDRGDVVTAGSNGSYATTAIYDDANGTTGQGSGYVDIAGTYPTPDGDAPAYVLLDFNTNAGLDSFLATVNAGFDSSSFTFSTATTGSEIALFNSLASAYAGAGRTWDALIRFGTLPSGASASNLDFNWQLAAGSGFSIDKVAVVPEPSTLTALGAIGVGMLARRRRRA